MKWLHSTSVSSYWFHSCRSNKFYSYMSIKSMYIFNFLTHFTLTTILNEEGCVFPTPYPFHIPQSYFIRIPIVITQYDNNVNMVHGPKCAQNYSYFLTQSFFVFFFNSLTARDRFKCVLVSVFSKNLLLGFGLALWEAEELTTSFTITSGNSEIVPDQW